MHDIKYIVRNGITFEQSEELAKARTQLIDRQNMTRHVED